MGAQFHFGSGRLIAKASGSNPTPVPFGTLQDCSLDLGFDIKRLMGENNFPVDIGRSGGKITGKAKVGQINLGLYDACLLGATSGVATGQTLISDRQSGTIPATPFILTPTVPSSGTYVEDLGVILVSTATIMQRVASSPTTGQYSVNESTGAYTFAAADTGLAVLITYAYTITGGFTVAIENKLQGSAPVFSLSLFNSRNANGLYVKLYKAVGTKLTFPFTNEDFLKHDFEFEAFADDTLGVGKISSTNR
jgi:hypothetical protein